MIFLKRVPFFLMFDIIGDKKIRIQVYLILIFKFQPISPKNTKKNPSKLLSISKHILINLNTQNQIKSKHTFWILIYIFSNDLRLKPSTLINSRINGECSATKISINKFSY